MGSEAVGCVGGATVNPSIADRYRYCARRALLALTRHLAHGDDADALLEEAGCLLLDAEVLGTAGVWS